jgi:Restriction endonuclease/DnaB-like helicase N terminal domain
VNQREADNDSGIERKVLGNILINPEVILPLMDFLRPADFSRGEHRTVYEAVLSLTRQVQPSGGPFPSETLYETLYPGPAIERLVKSGEGKNEAQVSTVLLYNHEELAHLSPSFHLLEEILEEGSFLDRLHWRAFEELVADLLEKDGYRVQLGPGTKDGGKDIIAMKELEGHGWFMSVWQAKKLKPEKKVELSVIRELADTRQKQNASKGIIVTSTYLTRGALDRVTEDRFLLGKVDRDDLMQWVQRVKRRYKV